MTFKDSNIPVANELLTAGRKTRACAYSTAGSPARVTGVQDHSDQKKNFIMRKRLYEYILFSLTVRRKRIIVVGGGDDIQWVAEMCVLPFTTVTRQEDSFSLSSMSLLCKIEFL